MTLIEQFCSEYHDYNDISEDRRRRHRKCLLEFEDHVSPRTLIEATGQDLRDWLGELVTEGYNPTTVRQRKCQITPFYHWAFERGFVSGDVLMSMRSVPLPRGAHGDNLPKPYAREEIEQFWRRLDEVYPPARPVTIKNWRNGRAKYWRVRRHAQRLQIRAIAGIALFCGLRRVEIFSAEVNDIHHLNEYIVVRYGTRKGDGQVKPRQVPLPQAAADLIEEWLDFRDLILATESPNGSWTNSPWLSLYSVHRTGAMNWRQFGRILNPMGDWKLRRFRHTCGTEWYRAGMKLEKVSRLLGHATLQQTLGYAKIVKQDVLMESRQFGARLTSAVGPPREGVVV